MICFVGIARVEETESNIEDHKSCGGSTGLDERESSIAAFLWPATISDTK